MINGYKADFLVVDELPHVERMRTKRMRKNTEKERDLERRNKRRDKQAQRV